MVCQDRSKARILTSGQDRRTGEEEGSLCLPVSLCPYVSRPTPPFTARPRRDRSLFGPYSHLSESLPVTDPFPDRDPCSGPRPSSPVCTRTDR